MLIVAGNIISVKWCDDQSDIYGYPQVTIACHGGDQEYEIVQELPHSNTAQSRWYDKFSHEKCRYHKANLLKYQYCRLYGLFSSYMRWEGKLVNYLLYVLPRRVFDGYRDNAESDASAQFASLQYDFSDKIDLRFEIGRSEYRIRSRSIDR